MSNSLSMTKFNKILKQVYGRKYNLYEVGYVRCRQKKESVFTSKRKAERLFKQYQDKYKSAYFYINRPPSQMVSERNAILSRIRNRQDFVGKIMAAPSQYGIKV